MKSTLLLSILSLGLAAAACSSDPKPPAAAPAGPVEAPSASAQEQASAAPAGDEADDPSRSSVNISDEIKKACGLTDKEAFFDFDSAAVKDSSTGVLKKLATCFATGALKGRTMLLVGHADPRGDSEYNMVLGGRRAENVKLFLGKAGLAAQQMTTNSRGAMDATGTDEASYAKDRRVDVLLAP